MRTGPRPAYVYDLATVRDNITALRAALPAGTLIAYALKANGNDTLLRGVLRWTDGLEAASGAELTAAVTAGSPFTLLSGPAKTDDDLRAAAAAGAVINAESLHELRRIAHVAPGARICLRVNRTHPALPGTHRMSGAPTQFGIAEPQLAAAVALAARLDVAGFHLHAVSNNLDAAAHAAFITDAVEWAQHTADTHGIPLQLINVGGGFGVDVTGATTFDLDTLAAGLHGLHLPAGSRLVVEPGRYVAATAGWYAADVTDVKHSHGRWFAVIRGGTHHFRLPASWNYSHPFTVLPVDHWPYPFDRPTVTGAPVDVAGEQCNPRDILARDAQPTTVRAGDILVFPNTGAYGWEVAHHDFLRLAHPTFTVLDC
ncbi:type III PLP-dependent enzyme [Dactylosporangium sucinum]|uniref:type III PLP-dependent enzyme n=1 Tax=Dactylosporangium sucinum TaxID=1424081 RepID=UPI001E3FAD1D|nr:type III PLP-dependent enzyme [Dactylosporangium sucinum]